MNRDDIIRIAKAVGLGKVDDDGDIWCSDGFYTEEIDSFAQFAYDAGRKAERERIKWDSIHSCHPECDKPVCVAIRKAVEEEREACAKVCMDKWMEWMDASPDKRLDMRNDAEDCAFAIRERGAP